MFRRFMIVCWVLFAIPAIVSLVSWPMYYKYGAEIEALDVKPWELFDPKELLDETSQEDDAPGNPFTEELAHERAVAIRNAEIRLQSRELELKRESWGIAAFAGMGIAAGILLWNILCHTVVWIIAGRQIYG